MKTQITASAVPHILQLHVLQRRADFTTWPQLQVMCLLFCCQLCIYKSLDLELMTPT